MAVDINFINLDDNNTVLGPEIDLGIENSVLLDLQFDITEPGNHAGFIYRNDAKIGEFGKNSARGKYLEWYAGTGVPIYVKNGDVFKAVVQVGNFCPLPIFDVGESGPGPNTFTGYTEEDCKGFFGEVPSTELITMSDLTSQLGVTQGTAQNLDASWLKFYLDGRILFVSKKTIRHSISYDHLRNKGVIDGSKIITINGLQYRVGLLSGIDDDYAGEVITGYNRSFIMRSEWNRLMYNVASDAGFDTEQQKQGQIGDNWVEYPQDDSTNGLNISVGNGGFSWTRNLDPSNSNHAVHRGYYSATYVLPSWTSNVYTFYGWRPVLELIQE